jgi:hypothetical protein
MTRQALRREIRAISRYYDQRRWDWTGIVAYVAAKECKL